MTAKKISFAFVLITAMVLLVTASGSCLSVPNPVQQVCERPDGGIERIDGGRVFGPTGAVGRLHIRIISVTNCQLHAGQTDYMPVAAAESAGDDVCATGPDGVSLYTAKEIPAGSDKVTHGEDKTDIIAGGDVLRSLLTLPSVAVANDFSSQHKYAGAAARQGNVARTGDVLLFQQTGNFTVNETSFRAAIDEATRALETNLPLKLFHVNVEVNQVDRNDPRYKPVLPRDYYRATSNSAQISALELAAMSVEESERKHTPYPFTDKGNHLCRDLVGYFNLKGVFKSNILAAGSTYLLSTGFELLEPQIDGKVRGPNYYDPLYGAAGYAFYILQDQRLLPRDLWWALNFYTDDNPIHDSEHKPMRAELHYTLPHQAMSVDFKVFYDNQGYDPTIAYPTNIRISSSSWSEHR